MSSFQTQTVIEDIYHLHEFDVFLLQVTFNSVQRLFPSVLRQLAVSDRLLPCHKIQSQIPFYAFPFSFLSGDVGLA